MDFEFDDGPLTNRFAVPNLTCGCPACQGDLTPEQRDVYRTWRDEEDRIALENEERAERRARRLREEARVEQERQDRLSGVECNICSARNPRRSTYSLPNDERGCTNCYARCSQCRAVHKKDDLNEHRSMYGDAVFLCSNCVGACTECENVLPSSQVYQVVDEEGRFCQNCAYYCDYCGNRYVESCNCSDSSRSSGTGRGVMGYGKTHAKHWLGGPQRKSEIEADTRYYLGFELEIYSSDDTDSNVRPVYEWAEENLGFDDGLDCKSDSSVDGFEIATQPMTPEFFEGVDWTSFFDVLNENYRTYRGRQEPTAHGLHVHISRTAFKGDDVALAAFCYLINQDDHLERIARRSATTYCKKVDKPVSHAIKKVNSERGKFRKQASKSSIRDVYLDRNAINLLNNSTVEIRAFRSTRDPQELKDAVRLVYVAAEYIRYLRAAERSISPKSLRWDVFAKWVGTNHPAAYESIAGQSMPAMADA